MLYKISKNNKVIKGEIDLTSSKSISNRLLIIQKLNNDNIIINNLSGSEDTRIIQKALNSTESEIDAGHAGTAMRFLTAYFAQKDGEWMITGTERMKNRPIGFLVDGLRQLGADITYVEKEGYPPLKISGKKLSGNYVKIDGSISSQFITAILLIGPCLSSGLKLELINKIASVPYIRLTLELMNYFGIDYKWEENIINLNNQKYQNKEITVEADWSGASYWYEIASFANEVDLKINGLSKNSLQGDAIISKIFESFGIQTHYIEKGIHLKKDGRSVSFFDFDFANYPDLVQTIAVTCAINKVPFKITGAESLKIKETNRIEALQNELRKFGIEIKETSSGVIEWDGKINDLELKQIEIDTYDDHRIAMAFAPVALSMQSIMIKNPNVVVKSYPDYWTDLKKVGFKIIES